jgi:uncharacterized protein (DUF488 family)
MKLYTIGYGGRSPDEFLDLLKENGVGAVVDVRLRPDRSSMGAYRLARKDTEGVRRLLNDAQVQYYSFVELGNLFLDFEDWQVRYQRPMDKSGDLLAERLLALEGPFCLLCAEKSPSRCHRSIIAEYLVGKGYEVEHIE